MKKIRAFVMRLLDNPLYKLEQLAGVIVVLSALAGLIIGFSGFFVKAAIFGFDFGDFLEGLLFAVISCVISGIIGWITSLSLCCYVLFIRNHQRQADATQQIARYMAQSVMSQDAGKVSTHSDVTEKQDAVSDDIQK